MAGKKLYCESNITLQSFSFGVVLIRLQLTPITCALALDARSADPTDVHAHISTFRPQADGAEKLAT
jgi:hypothetical protein